MRIADVAAELGTNTTFFKINSSEELFTLKVSVSAPHWLLFGLSFLQPARVAALNTIFD